MHLARRVATAVKGAAPRRWASIEARCVRYARNGHATADGVLKLDTVKLDSAALGAKQVLVKMVAAPITATDLSTIAGFGSAGSAAGFPRVAGNEGVGIVEAAGASAGLKKGDVVVASRAGLGTWSTHVVSDGDGWTALSAEHAAALGSDALPVEVAATAVVSPLLAKLLVAGLPSGSVLLQNLAMSTVGQAVIQYAAAGGIKTVNIMRKHNDWDNRMYHLQGRGAGIIIDEDYARITHKFHRLLADLPAPARALNGAGGSSAGSLLKALAPGGTMVTYGAMSGQPVRVPAGALLAKGITLTGASLERELAGKSKAERDAAVREVVADVAGGKDAKVVQLLAREDFASFPAALARALRMGERKVVLRM